jgi:predicted transcriptional regulator
MVKRKSTSRQKKVVKRTFLEIRKIILFSLSSGQKNINELADTAGVNWRTTRNHLIYLIGMGYVKEVISTPQVRIIEITQYGMEALARKWK